MYKLYKYRMYVCKKKVIPRENKSFIMQMLDMDILLFRNTIQIQEKKKKIKISIQVYSNISLTISVRLIIFLSYLYVFINEQVWNGDTLAILLNFPLP